MSVLDRSLDAAPRDPLVPEAHRVVARREETSDVVSLWLEPLEGGRMAFRCGQFNMVSAYGVGEIAVSVSAAPSEAGPLRHSVRDVGAVSHALCATRVGDLVGVRGPFGTHWGIAPASGPDHDTRDQVILAGGVGLAPLRGAASELLAARAGGGGRVFVLVGARDPSQLVFTDDLDEWWRQGARVMVTVDRANSGWNGRVGVVTSLLGDAGFDPTSCRVLVCGPEIMMRFSARAVMDLGVDPTSVLVSLERNMQCGVGRCGHCQLGPLLLCRDGPVVPYAGVVAELLNERER